MDTSDSECFESADEEFEIELHKKVTSSQDTSKSPTLKFEGLEVKGDPDHEPKTNLDTPDKVERRKPRPKLGTKLGTRMVKSDSNLTSNQTTTSLEDTKSSRNESVDSPQIREEPNLWENDDWETTFTHGTEHNESSIGETENHASNLNNWEQSWSSWGNWGVSSFLSTASSITSQVSQGLTNVIESGIGAPNPTDLAKQIQTEMPDKSTDQIFGIGNLISGVSQITKLVETTGTKVISGGLDTLETIGKKTMEVLQEGDPGFKKKRAFLKIESDKPVLSQILREAKEKAEHDNQILEQKHFSKKANYEMLFDDHQGLVHLEALEMLSKQCDIKLQTILETKSGAELLEMQETMAQIKELCELNEDDDENIFKLDELEESLKAHILEMNIIISYDKLISTWADAEMWFKNLNLTVCNEMELHEQAIDTLAQLTAISVERFHKAGELLLIKEHRSTVDEADSLVQLTTLLTNLIGYVAKILSDKLHEKSSSCKNQENMNNLMTNIYFEAANSSSYIKNAFQLLIPILQVGAI